MKERIRVKAPTRVIGRGVPDDANPGDLVIGNRGASAEVRLDARLRLLHLDYIGNFHQYGSYANKMLFDHTRKVYDFSGGTRP